MQRNAWSIMIVGWLVCVAPVMAATYAPWHLLSGRFGDTVHEISRLPPLAVGSQHPGALFASGAAGGTYRSLDCGESWEPVNGGRTWGEAYGGGYPEATAECPPDTSCLHHQPFRGPPATELGALASTAGTAFGTEFFWAATGYDSETCFGIALGGGCLNTTVWRGGLGGPYFSSDGGNAWQSLSMGCQGTEPTGDPGDHPRSPVHALAVDEAPGMGAHVVAAREHDLGGPSQRTAEASGCYTPSLRCGERQIAWVDDAQLQMLGVRAVAANATTGGPIGAPPPLAGNLSYGAGDPAAALVIDGLSDWKYTPLVHLATTADATAMAPTCLALTQPLATCKRDNQRACHGKSGFSVPGGSPNPGAMPYVPWSGSEPIESACLDKGAGDCKCVASAACKYPDVAHLMIDPRNGFAYASTNVGLLVSADGGRSWVRNWDDPEPSLKPNPAKPYVKANVRLMTGDAEACPPGAMNPPFGCDLNRVPQRIVHVGAMSWNLDGAQTCDAAHPHPNAANFLAKSAGHCTDPEAEYYREFADNPVCTRTGRLTAYLPVTWTVGTADGGTTERSSVFVAFSDPCDVTDGLTFIDMRTLG